MDKVQGNFLELGLLFRWIKTIEGGAEMIRDLFIAFVVLILTVTATTWLNVSPRLRASAG